MPSVSARNLVKCFLLLLEKLVLKLKQGLLKTQTAESHLQNSDSVDRWWGGGAGGVCGVGTKEFASPASPQVMLVLQVPGAHFKNDSVRVVTY